MVLNYIVLGAFIATLLAIAYWEMGKTKTTGDFLLGGKTFGPWILAVSYGTTYFSAVVFIGFAGQFGWTAGFGGLWIGLMNALVGSALAWLVLRRRTPPYDTQPEHDDNARVFSATTAASTCDGLWPASFLPFLSPIQLPFLPDWVTFSKRSFT